MLQTYTLQKGKEPLSAVLGAKDTITICIAPEKHELTELVTALDLDHDMLMDALDRYETPRVEQYKKASFFYARYCRPNNNELATEPVTIIDASGILLVIFREKSLFSEKLLEDIRVPYHQRTRYLLSIMLEINHTYRKYLLKVSKDILEVRSRLNKHEVNNSDFVNFIDIEEDLNEITGTLQSYGHLLSTILRGKTIKMYEDDIDLAEDVDLGIKELLSLAETRKLTITSTREAYSTIMANNLNKTFKRLTSISIFLMIPTIVSGLYGMNVRLPYEKSSMAFYGLVVLIGTGVIASVLYFKKLRWL